MIIRVIFWILAALMLYFIIVQVRSRLPRLISFFIPGSRNLSFQDKVEPPIDELHRDMIKPVVDKLEALGFTQLGLMVEKTPLWGKGSRELVMVSSKDRIIAILGLRGPLLSYYFYTPFEDGQVVVTAHNCFKNFVKPDFVTSEIKSGDLDEMLESHQKDVADFVAKGYVPFHEYSRESVIMATNLYYQSPYPSMQLRYAGGINVIFFLLCLFLLYLLIYIALGRF
jgi:hypothetical protein